MDKLLKPAKLAIDVNSGSAAKQWRHWLKTFQSYVSLYSEASSEVKLAALINCATPEVFEHFDHCESYEEAEATLEKLFVKQPNEIFARHLLRTEKQRVNQSLADFRCALTRLAKDCNFKDVTAAQYKDDMIRDAFINGIMSTGIRQRLLEHKALTMNEAYTKAVTLDDAKRDNLLFSNRHAAEPENNSVNSIVNTEPGLKEDQTAVINKPRGVCLSCGSDRPHDYKRCRAKALNCYNCGQKGHFSRACRVKKNAASTSKTLPVGNSAFVDDKNYSLCIMGVAAGQGFENNAYNTVTSQVDNQSYRTLLDTGSSKNFVNSVVARNFITEGLPLGFSVGMAQSSTKVEVHKICKVDINMLGHTYTGINLYVMENLCVDILLGREFMKLHKFVNFAFGGNRDGLIVPKHTECAVVAADINTPSLFASLSKDCKPIATKSRRFNQKDREYIKSKVMEWKKAGTIRPSTSPWRAQCVVVKNGNHIERLAIDYSQTVNLFTEKDGFPIPLIEDIVNQLACFRWYASYDLKRAYHQVPIAEKDKPYTAFKAAGELFEFNVMPFGVTNGGPIFQRIMTQVIKQDRLVDTFVYFDNIIIGAYSMDDLDRRASEFRGSMSKRKMTLNDSKTIYGVQTLQILGYCVGNNTIKPDPERLKPLWDLPPPVNFRTLKRVLGLFAYYAKWVPRFSDKIWRLKSVNKFPLQQSELNDFNQLKDCIAAAALNAIDESQPFTVECDASDVAVSATLNQQGRPVAFMSRSLSGSELAYPAIEKEATAIIEAVRKWGHLLIRRHFVLITDQRSVAFMLDARKRTKIKNNKILCWRLELSSFSYTIRYRPGTQNVVADALTRASCSAVGGFSSKLDDLHKELCCPGVTRLWNFVRLKNLPYSLEEVKRCCNGCVTCAEVKPQFYKLNHQRLVKATQPMERLNVDFKGPLPRSISRNSYFLCVVDEYSRYPFCFPCADTSAAAVIGCLEKLFSLFGTCNYVHSDRGSAFFSKQLKEYLLQKGVATSHTTPYHPEGNSQCERYNGIIWRSVKCALKSRELPIERWETVLPVALDSIRSLLCTATGESPHTRFLRFNRRSHFGISLPEWLSQPGPVLLRKFVRSGKNDDLVQKVELIHANPLYARIRYPDGRESNISLRDLAKYPTDADGGARRLNFGCSEHVDRESNPNSREELGINRNKSNVHWDASNIDPGAPDVDQSGSHDDRNESNVDRRGSLDDRNESNVDGNESTVDRDAPDVEGVKYHGGKPRRSARFNKGVPPDRLGI